MNQPNRYRERNLDVQLARVERELRHVKILLLVVLALQFLNFLGGIRVLFYALAIVILIPLVVWGVNWMIEKLASTPPDDPEPSRGWP